jgi:predicted Zn finger-like uncharacterized protein
MRFVCDSCRAQYMISDDKVGANGVKVRCKKCGNVIVVRRPQDAEADAALSGLEESAAQPPAPEAPTGENSIFSGVDDDEIGAAFESALGERQDDQPAAPPEEEPPPEANVPPVSDGPPRAHDWYVAIDDKQTGPLTPEAIKDHWDRGEIGPDSLTWRQGFEDWVPLSEVSELAAWLAPRPQRPVFSPPAPSASGSMPVVPVPVESAFNAGGVMRTVRAEVPTPVPETAGGWKPSASAALASLVKEEIDALSKPESPPPAPEPVAGPRGLLEVPPPTGEVPAASVNGRPARTEAPTPVTNVERPPSFTPAYPYATRPVRAQAGNKGLLIGIGVAVLVVLGAVGGGGWYLLQRQKASELAVRQAPLPTPEPAKVAPPPEPPKVAQAQPAAQAAAPTPPVTPSVATPVPKVTAAVPPGEGTGTGTRRGTRGSRHGGKSSGGDDQVASAEPAPKSSGGKQSKADDLFDEVFGTGGGSSSRSEESRSSGKKTAYVPPAPGSSSTEVPERLPKGDIMSVVLANKPSIVRCVNEQKTRDPNLHGTLVMHWVIQTSGKTASVNAVTDQFRSTYMATCLTGLVKSWNFPKHKYQPGEPVDFPFTF